MAVKRLWNILGWLRLEFEYELGNSIIPRTSVSGQTTVGVGHPLGQEKDW